MTKAPHTHIHTHIHTHTQSCTDHSLVFHASTGGDAFCICPEETPVPRRIKFYQGTLPSGCNVQSIHGKLYRVSYVQRIGTRTYPQDEVVPASNEQGARVRVTQGYHKQHSIVGPIEVTYLYDLEPVYAS